MNNKAVAFGFLLYFTSSVIAGTFVAPYLTFLTQWLGFAGAYAGYLFGSIISFPVLALTFWAASKAHIHGEIPEVS